MIYISIYIYKDEFKKDFSLHIINGDNDCDLLCEINIFILYFESKGWWLVNQKKLQLIVIPPLLETWIAPKYQN